MNFVSTPPTVIRINGKSGVNSGIVNLDQIIDIEFYDLYIKFFGGASSNSCTWEFDNEILCVKCTLAFIKGSIVGDEILLKVRFDDAPAGRCCWDCHGDFTQDHTKEYEELKKMKQGKKPSILGCT